MATKSTVPTVANGDSWSAAQQNTYLRDNIEALWPYTTAGDMAYATAANQLARLGVGSNHQLLKVVSGAPAWGSLDRATVNHGTTQNIGHGSPTALVFNSEISDAPGWHSTVSNTSRITVTDAGEYLVSAYFFYQTGGGSLEYDDFVFIQRSGSVVGGGRWRQTKDALAKWFSITIPIIGAGAGQYFEVVLEQYSGETAVVGAGARFSVLRVA